MIKGCEGVTHGAATHTVMANVTTVEGNKPAETLGFSPDYETGGQGFESLPVRVEFTH